MPSVKCWIYNLNIHDVFSGLQEYGNPNIASGMVLPMFGGSTNIPLDLPNTPMINSTFISATKSSERQSVSPGVSTNSHSWRNSKDGFARVDRNGTARHHMNSGNTSNDTYRQRLQTLQQACKDHTMYLSDLPQQPSAFRVFLVDEHRKYIFCFLPKVASTVWKRALGMLSDNFKEDEPRTIVGNNSTHNPSSFVHWKDYISKIGLKYLSDYKDASEREHLLKTFYKFTFVRNPYERLLSTYRHKFLLTDVSNRNYYLVHYGRKIAQRYRSGSRLYAGNDVTFTEFLHYVIDEHEAGRNVDEHWDTYTNLCLPCSVQYDFIGKLESLQADAAYITQTVFDTDRSTTHLFNADFGPRSQRELGTNSSTVFREMYANIPLSLLERLQKIFGRDARFFGYGGLLWPETMKSSNSSLVIIRFLNIVPFVQTQKAARIQYFNVNTTVQLLLFSLKPIRGVSNVPDI